MPLHIKSFDEKKGMGWKVEGITVCKMHISGNDWDVLEIVAATGMANTMRSVALSLIGFLALTTLLNKGVHTKKEDRWGEIDFRQCPKGWIQCYDLRSIC